MNTALNQAMIGLVAATGCLPGCLPHPAPEYCRRATKADKAKRKKRDLVKKKRKQKCKG